MTRRFAIAVVDALESRRLMAATLPGVYAFGGRAGLTVFDADRTAVTVSLSRGSGKAEVLQSGAITLNLTGTSGASVLKVSTAGGDGRVTLAGISASGPLNSVSAPTADVTGVVSLVAVKSVTFGTARDMSFTCAGAISSLTVGSWTDSDSTADTLVAPAIAKLTVAGAFAPNVTLTSAKGTALAKASVGGVTTGKWSVASAGTVTLGTVRGTIDIRGKVASLSLADPVAVAKVASATGGVLHVGSGKVSAAGGLDRFGVAGSTIYTASAETYTYDDLYHVSRVGESWTYREPGGARYTMTVLPEQEVEGREAYVVRAVGMAGTQELAYAIDPAAGVSLLRTKDPEFGGNVVRFTGLRVAPPTFRLGQTFSDAGSYVEEANGAGASESFTGTVTYTSKFAGHELVKVPAGQFLAVKLNTTIDMRGSGTVEGSPYGTVNASIRQTSTNAEHCVPAVGELRSDYVRKVTVSVPAYHLTRVFNEHERIELMTVPK